MTHPTPPPMGSRTRITCDLDVHDAIDVARVGVPKTPGARVSVAHLGHVFLGGGRVADGAGQVTLTPAKARILAAAILNAADEADGTVRLVFMPTCPQHDGKEPQR